MSNPVRLLLTEAVNKTALDLVLADVFLGERYEVCSKPRFNTACWAFLPPHRIYLGEDLFENARPGLTRDEQLGYACALLKHELGHLRFTERNMAKIREMLTIIKAPFMLWNLMEDARIEHFSRAVDKLNFRWLDFEHPGQEPRDNLEKLALVRAQAIRPESILFRLIQAETDDLAHPALNSFLQEQPLVVREMAVIVQTMYRRMTKAATSLGLKFVLMDWLRIFPESATNSSSPNSLSSDLSLTEQLQVNPDFRARFERDVLALTGSVAPKHEFQVEVTAGSVAVADAGSGNLLRPTGTPFNRDRAKAVAAKLERILAVPARPTPSATPSKKLNVKGVALGSSQLYRRNLAAGHRRKKIAVVVDCSGSMDGEPMDEGKILVAALNLLAMRGQLTGCVILSGVLDGRAIWQRFTFPLEESVIDNFDAMGDAEGLEPTLAANIKELTDCDHVFVYTDGRICDKPIEKAVFHQKGLYTVGLYCNRSLTEPKGLLEYFDRYFVRDTVESLLDALLKTLRGF